MTIQYITSTYGNFDVNMGDTILMGQYPGFIRGTAEMGAGVFGASALEKISVDKNNKSWIVLEYALFLFLLFELFILPHSKYDAVFVLGCFFLIPLAFANGVSDKYGKIFRIINKLSLTMFFCQNFVRLIWKYLAEKYEILMSAGFGITMILFLISLVIVGVLLELVVRFEKSIVNSLIKKYRA